MASVSESDPLVEQDSEDDLDWEEVHVPEHQQGEHHFEITIPTTKSSKKTVTPSKFKGIPHAERLQRIDCHKLHTVVLLVNAWIRNKWLNDELLQARLLSLTPLSLQTAFGVIHKSRIPDPVQRGRTFEQAITNLVEWWSSTYFEVVPEGHIKNRTYDNVQAKLAKLSFPPTGPDAILDIEDIENIFGNEPERIRSPKSLMKHALMTNGSRDTSAQLFTALCRGLGVPARLVVSLQSVPWQTHIGKPKPAYSRKPKGDKGKGKAKESENGENFGDNENSTTASFSRSGSEAPSRSSLFAGDGQRLDGTPVPKSEKAKGKEKAKPVITLRKTKSKGRVLCSGAGSSTAGPSKLAAPDPRTTPPVFWTEVFSRPDGRWIPVDPIRAIVNKRKAFDPTPTSALPPVHSSLFPQAYAAAIDRRTTASNTSRSVRQENRMVYVMAFEEDGYARDVTRRYAKEYSAKIAKMQGGSSTIGGGGAARLAWWEAVVGTVSRPYRLHRDDVEDEELDAAQMTEGMPTTISGFKDHPIYALARHLKQNQVIHPPDTSEIGKFRGEAVYPRSAVVPLKTAENWMRSEGRMISEGQQPLKMVKIRAGTINRMRELEVMKDELKEAGDPGGLAETMQGLYARNQTEPYLPDPVIDGKVPKNNFGNIDLYVPSMLPRGAVHVPFKGAAKIARKLDFDFAEAVIGFEFKKRRAFPVIEGVVVAHENEAALREAYWEAEQDAEEKARIKRDERVIKHWTRLIHGLRIRQRLQAQYAPKPEVHSQDGGHKTDRQPGTSKDIIVTMSHPGVGAGGGFLVGADDVVQPFHLPKAKYQPLEEATATGSPNQGDQAGFPERVRAEESMIFSPGPNDGTYNLGTLGEDSDVDMELEEVIISKPQLREQNGRGAAPKTMQELAEDLARRNNTEDDDYDEYIDTNALGTSSSARGPDEHGVIQSNSSPRSLRVTLKLPNNPATSSGTSTPGGKDVASRRTSARLPRKAKPKKRARDDDTDDETDEDISPPTPKKRATKMTENLPAPTRTLRPRASKSAAQMKEAEEQEEAYRRAIER